MAITSTRGWTELGIQPISAAYPSPLPATFPACWQRGQGLHCSPKHTATAAPSVGIRDAGPQDRGSGCHGDPIARGQNTDVQQVGAAEHPPGRAPPRADLGSPGSLWALQVRDRSRGTRWLQERGSSKQLEAATPSKGAAVCRASICLRPKIPACKYS